MARDLALPPVASPPMHSGTNSSESHNHRPQDTGELFVEPPSPDRVEMSSSEESDDLDGGEVVEEAEEGEELYRQFLARRMAEERLMDEGVSSIDVRRRRRSRRSGAETETVTIPRQISNGGVREDLATLAERFARSEGREAVRRRADQVELCSLTQDNFSHLLSELFQDGGITQERVLVLFFFCSDLALRALRAGLRTTLSQLTRWSVAFLRGTVAVWVRCKGGWDNLLNGRTRNRQVLLWGASLALLCLWVVYKKHK